MQWPYDFVIICFAHARLICYAEHFYFISSILSTDNECAGIYSPNAYRGFAREFIKDLERIR